MTESPVLLIEKLHVELRRRRHVVHAVGGISLEIRQGETVGLVGESGCGKTTVGLAVLGLLPRNGRVTAGAIQVCGHNMLTLSRKELRHVQGEMVSLVFQDPLTSLNPTTKVGLQVGEPLVVHRGASRAQARREAIEMLDLVGLPKPRQLADSYPHELSGGMRQRALIAMALICRPSLLIADEPTTALDVTIQAQILSLLARLKQELGMAMLIVTHDMGVIAGQADRVAVMYAGQIVEEGDVQAVFKRCRHRYTEALLESIPQLEGHVEALQTIPGRPPDLTQELHGCRFAARCRYATDRCEHEPPVSWEAENHSYRCHHPAQAGAARAATRKA